LEPVGVGKRDWIGPGPDKDTSLSAFTQDVSPPTGNDRITGGVVANVRIFWVVAGLDRAGLFQTQDGRSLCGQTKVGLRWLGYRKSIKDDL
jgi:hypothetical protein